MNFRRRRWSVGLLVGVLLLLALALAAYTAKGSFERTLRVTGPVELEVKTGSGSIKVRTGEAGQVRVLGTIKARTDRGLTREDVEEKVRRLETNPPIEQEGNVIRIGHIEDEDLQHRVSIRYELVVPHATELRLTTGSGSQQIDGVRGPVKASTGSGEIQVRAINGAVRLSTGSGSIHGSGIAGAISASTGSGNVVVEQSAPGRVEVSTGSGDVEVRGVRGSLHARTGSGSITAEGEPTGEWELVTSSGGIRVGLPSEMAFDVHVRTSSGGIHIDHPVTVRGKLSRRELRGKVRGGGVLIAARTSSGTIRIE